VCNLGRVRSAAAFERTGFPVRFAFAVCCQNQGVPADSFYVLVDKAAEVLSLEKKVRKCAIWMRCDHLYGGCMLGARSGDGWKDRKSRINHLPPEALHIISARTDWLVWGGDRLIPVAGRGRGPGLTAAQKPNFRVASICWRIAASTLHSLDKRLPRDGYGLAAVMPKLDLLPTSLKAVGRRGSAIGN
jgi:hypothetical protein